MKKPKKKGILTSMENQFEYNFNHFLEVIDNLEKSDREKAQIINHCLNKLKIFKGSSVCLNDKEIKEILECFNIIEKNAFSYNHKELNSRNFLYFLAETFFSHNSPVGKIHCLSSKENIQKLMAFVYEKNLKPYVAEVWWLIQDNINNYYEAFLRLIPVTFLQSFTEKALKMLDTFPEDNLINNFFSQKENWPKWIGEMQKIKIVEINSEKVKSYVYDLFWVIPDSVANRIRYKLWESFVNYLLNYFDLKSSDVSQWDNVERAKKEIHELYLNCYKLPDLILPVIEEILEIAREKDSEKYKEFTRLNS